MIKIFLITLLFSFPAIARTKAIATSPGKSTVYVTLTVEEQAARDAEEAVWLSRAGFRDWETQMKSIDLSSDLENIIEAMDAATRARIPAETLDKYNAKKALRALKPLP